MPLPCPMEHPPSQQDRSPGRALCVSEIWSPHSQGHEVCRAAVPSPTGYTSPQGASGLPSQPSQLFAGTGRDVSVTVVVAPGWCVLTCWQALAVPPPSRDLHAGELVSPVELHHVKVGRVQVSLWP